MTKQATEKARRDLQAIISNLAYKDYKVANPKLRKSIAGRRKHKPYTLSNDAMEALDVLQMTYKTDIAAEDEEIIKGYLLPFRTVRTEYLINTDPRLR